MLVVLVVGSDRMSRTASRVATVNSTDGRIEKMPETQTMIEEFGNAMAAPQ
jgi:hypothetical protein